MQPGYEAVAAVWGRLSAAATQRGRPPPVNDMWVAACCLTYEAPLAPVIFVKLIMACSGSGVLLWRQAASSPI
jgi:hypothetical protein